MASQIINNYISDRYDRWLDYARYHCTHAKMEGEAIDVLNEVLIMLIEKCDTNEDTILKLYESKKGKYRELDFFILQMIKLNVQSPTSPYQHKYKSIPTDDNIDYQNIDLIEDEEFVVDRSAIIFEEMKRVRDVFEGLNLSDKVKRIFSWKFFEGNRFSEWMGPEEKKDLYIIYNKVIELVVNKLNNRELF